MNVSYTQELPLTGDRSFMSAVICYFHDEFRKLLDAELPKSNGISRTVSKGDWTMNPDKPASTCVFIITYRRASGVLLTVHVRETRKVVLKRVVMTMETITEDEYNKLSKKSTASKGGGQS